MWLSRNLLSWAPVCALGLTLSSPVQAQISEELDVVRNGSFELGTVGWDLPDGMTRIETGIAHSGTASLRFQNRDPGVYKLITQRIPVQPGDTLSFSAWIKGENITSTNAGKGAGIFVESSDANGKWITGGYTAGFPGTYDWKQDKGTYGVPSTATSVVVGLYLRKESVGTAWFDDIEVRIQRKPEVSATLLYPNYRGLTTLKDQAPWQARVRFPAAAEAKAPIPVRHQLVDEQGKVHAESTSTVPAGGDSIVNLSRPPGLTEGRYNWKLELTAPGGKTNRFSFPIQIAARMPAKYIDAAGFTVINGKRFFPFGVFLGSTADEHLKRVSEGGFNTVLAYNNASPDQSRTYLDSAGKHNLQVVFSLCTLYEGHYWAPKGVTDFPALVTEYTRQLRDNPALLSWYINDELGLEWIPKIQPMYDLLTAQDREHPVYQVLLDPGLAEKYAPNTDVFGTDPYPVGKGTDLQRTSGYTRVLTRAAGPGKGTWMVPQIFDWGVYPKENTPSHPPTLDEMRNQAYQSLIHGAKGLLFYSYFDLWHEPKTRAVKASEFEKRWPDVVAMAKEINTVLPAILDGQEAPISRTGDSKVELRALEYQNELLLFLANPYYEASSISVTIPPGWQIRQSAQSNIQSASKPGQLTLTLPPVGSGVFRLVKEKA